MQAKKGFLSPLYELIRRPRNHERSSETWIGSFLRDRPAGAYPLFIATDMLVLAGIVGKAVGIFEGAAVLAIGIIVFIYSFDLINISEVLTYRSSDYFRMTKTPFRKMYKDKGLLGEYYNYLLGEHIKGYHKMLFNVCVPMPNGNYQEIDAILFTETCIYVIESKNRSGLFSGEVNGEEWVQNSWKGSFSNTLKNPLFQNANHITALDYLLKSDTSLSENTMKSIHSTLYYYNLIIFGEGAKFDLDDGLISSQGFINRKKAIKFFKKLHKEDKSLKVEELEEIYNALLPYSIFSGDERESMMLQRERRSLNKDFEMRHSYRYFIYNDYIPYYEVYGTGMNIRTDGIYTEYYDTQNKNWYVLIGADMSKAKEIY